MADLKIVKDLLVKLGTDAKLVGKLEAARAERKLVKRVQDQGVPGDLSVAELETLSALGIATESKAPDAAADGENADPAPEATEEQPPERQAPEDEEPILKEKGRTTLKKKGNKAEKVAKAAIERAEKKGGAETDTAKTERPTKGRKRAEGGVATFKALMTGAGERGMKRETIIEKMMGQVPGFTEVSAKNYISWGKKPLAKKKEKGKTWNPFGFVLEEDEKGLVRIKGGKPK